MDFLPDISPTLKVLTMANLCQAPLKDLLTFLSTIGPEKLEIVLDPKVFEFDSENECCIPAKKPLYASTKNIEWNLPSNPILARD